MLGLGVHEMEIDKNIKEIGISADSLWYYRARVNSSMTEILALWKRHSPLQVKTLLGLPKPSQASRRLQMTTYPSLRLYKDSPALKAVT